MKPLRISKAKTVFILRTFLLEKANSYAYKIYETFVNVQNLQPYCKLNLNMHGSRLNITHYVYLILETSKMISIASTKIKYMCEYLNSIFILLQSFRIQW